MGKRWTLEEIKKYVESNSDSKLLTTEYRGFSQKLLLKCDCGNNFEKTFRKFKDSNQRKCEACQPPKEAR